MKFLRTNLFITNWENIRCQLKVLELRVVSFYKSM